MVAEPFRQSPCGGVSPLGSLDPTQAANPRGASECKSMRAGCSSLLKGRTRTKTPLPSFLRRSSIGHSLRFRGFLFLRYVFRRSLPSDEDKCESLPVPHVCAGCMDHNLGSGITFVLRWYARTIWVARRRSRSNAGSRHCSRSRSLPKRAGFSILSQTEVFQEGSSHTSVWFSDGSYLEFIGITEQDRLLKSRPWMVDFLQNHQGSHSVGIRVRSAKEMSDRLQLRGIEAPIFNLVDSHPEAKPILLVTPKLVNLPDGAIFIS